MIHYEFSFDVREGLLGFIERLELGGLEYCPTWTRGQRRRHLWLVDYAQTAAAKSRKDQHGKGGFFDRCTQERINRLPADVRERIGRRS